VVQTIAVRSRTHPSYDRRLRRPITRVIGVHANTRPGLMSALCDLIHMRSAALPRSATISRQIQGPQEQSIGFEPVTGGRAKLRQLNMTSNGSYITQDR
jgi:hypothetical protein